MKNFRFLSVAVTMIMVLSVSAWAASSSSCQSSMLNIPSLPGQSNVVCSTLTGPSTSYMTKVNVKGTVGISPGCAAKYYLRLLDQNLNLIKEIPVSLGSGNYEIPFNPANYWPCNGAYCIGFRAELVASTVPICAATISGFCATFNCSP